jgi:hypothetical protein
MSTTTTAPNGRPQRKQLADEIDRLDQQMGDRLDRLDSILDAIAEGLPGAVTDTCRDGARAAVKDAIIEIVTNPELRALLAPAAPAAPAPVPAPAAEPGKPGPWTQLKARVAAARDAITGAAARAREAVAARCQAASETVAAVGRATGEALPWRRVLWVSLGVGLVVGLACLAVPHTAAAAVGAVTATSTSVAVQTGNWLKRVARRVSLI